MKLQKTALIFGVRFIKHKTFEDERGSFVELHQASNTLLEDVDFKQSNAIYSHQNIFRGFHVSLDPQFKLVHSVGGKVTQVLIDLRMSSPTYLKYMEIDITQGCGFSVLVPPHVAHGLYTHTPAIIQYQSSTEYVQGGEIAVNYPMFEGAVLSEKDQQGLTPMEAGDRISEYLSR